MCIRPRSSGVPGIRSHLFAGALLLALASPLRAADLLDYVIQAVDPTLAPARPLIECLAGGGAAEHCAFEAAKHQVAGALPIGPGDDRVKLAVGVFTAASEERWFDVLKIGGEVVAKSVSCAMLPLGGAVKGTACSIVGWVITHSAGTLDKAWRALTGPDWWALVDLLGTAACDLIPGDGAAGYAKDVLCGPLAGALLGAKKFAETLASGAVAGADALENLVFGDDSHMPYDRYFELYWQPWYHYSTARIWRNEGLGPAVGGVYNTCVDYFDSHNQYRSTAKKTCGDLKKKFDKHVKGFANALPVAVDGYFETVARPAIRGFARAGFGNATPENLPGEGLFVMNCEFQMRQRFPFPEPDETRCHLLADKAKQYAKVITVGPLYQVLAKSCYGEVKQQTLDPTIWAMACDDLRSRYRQVYTGETLKLLKTIGDVKKHGCVLADPNQIKKLRLDCQSYAAYAACVGALQPNGEKYCARPPVVLGETELAAEAMQAGPQATAAALGAAAPGSSGQDRRATRLPMPQQQATPPVETQPGRVATAPAIARLGRARQVLAAFEAETLLAAGKTRLRGGQTVAQGMTGFGPGWSGDAQLFWHGGAVGATLDLLVDVPADGAWAVEIALTQAPDYGELAFEVDHHPIELRFDGYAPRVAGPVSVALGTFAMIGGPRPVSLKIVGRNPAASGWLAGIDRIVLKPAS